LFVDDKLNSFPVSASFASLNVLLMTSIVFVNARQLWKNKKESKDIMRDIARERERGGEEKLN
jgi:hypothetical protein